MEGWPIAEAAASSAPSSGLMPMALAAIVAAVTPPTRPINWRLFGGTDCSSYLLTDVSAEDLIELLDGFKAWHDKVYVLSLE